MVPNAVSSEFRVISRGRASLDIRERFGIRRAIRFFRWRSAAAQKPDRTDYGLCQYGSGASGTGSSSGSDRSGYLVYAWRSRAAQASGVASRIHFTGFVSDADLVHFYNACDCFVFPSFYEGFGLPILEAMACGRAVACSNTSAMPEVAEGAGLLFDPRNPASIARTIADILLDTDLRERMESRGLQRAAHFNWRKSAMATLDVYREVVAEVNANREAIPVWLRPLPQCARRKPIAAPAPAIRPGKR